MSRPVRVARATYTASATRLLSLALALALAAALLVLAQHRSSQPLGSAPVRATDEFARVAAPAPLLTRVPGNFRGYGFDQCLAPGQRAMDRWLNHSPFLAVGIYIEGDSRACRSQPNLTPTWIRTQLRKGWRLLPITLGNQASCQPRFPRYNDDEKISPDPGRRGNYPRARAQGAYWANESVTTAKRLTIPANSVLWYDLEGFDYNNLHCRESALAFLSAWSTRIRELGYKSGVYSSTGSGIKMLDEARVNRAGRFAMPDMIWLARWDGVANTSAAGIREDGWRPGRRVKQYQGGHDETWGRVRINIDRNFLDVGRGIWAPAENRCGGVRVGWGDYPPIKAPKAGGAAPNPGLVSTLKCLLKEKGVYDGKLDGAWTKALTTAVRTWQYRVRQYQWAGFGRKNWMTLLAHGARPTLKFGSAGPDVRRVKRALNAAYDGPGRLAPDGRYDEATHRAVGAWQKRAGLAVNGVMGPSSWARLYGGVR